MKKLIVLFGFAMCCLFSGQVFAVVKANAEPTHVMEARPSCLLMKFSNATRYKVLDSDEVFSDYVLEKLLASKQLDIKEMQPLSDDVEKKLYDEKYINATNISKTKEGDFGNIFGDIYDVPISKANKGQHVNAEMTNAIGKQNNVTYLIQGTIVGIGTGQERNSFSLILDFDSKSARIGVVGDLRIIRASTGEVIWKCCETGEGKQGSFSVSDGYGEKIVKVGQANLNSNLYVRAMDELAQKLVNAMLSDIKSHKLNLS